MTFSKYLLKELATPASTLSPASVEEDKTKNQGSSGKVFPTDEEINSVMESADTAFWNVVVNSFKDKLESTDFNPSEQLAIFKKQQATAIKDWLKSNWPDDKSITNIKNLKGNLEIAKTQNPAGGSSEARI